MLVRAHVCQSEEEHKTPNLNAVFSYLLSKRFSGSLSLALILAAQLHDGSFREASVSL